MGENSLFSLENFPVFEPDHFSFGRGVDSANNFGFISCSSVDEGLLGFYFRGVWKIRKQKKLLMDIKMERDYLIEKLSIVIVLVLTIDEMLWEQSPKR